MPGAPTSKNSKTSLLRLLQTSPLLRCVVLVLAWAHLIFQLGVFLPRYWNRTIYHDVVVYFDAARAAHGGQPLYVFHPGYGPDPLPQLYFYPPPFAALLAPLGALPFIPFARLWCLLDVAAFWLYAWCLARLATGRVTPRRLLLAGLAVGLFPGSYVALQLGQADPLLWALFGLALAVERARGAALAAAALVKIYSVWPLMIAVRHEGRRVLLPALGIGLAGLLLGVAICGVQSYIDWVRYVLPVVGQGSFHEMNASLAMAGLRLARHFFWHYDGGPLGNGPRFYLTLMALLGPTLAWWRTRNRPPLVQYASVGFAAALTAPLCWLSYLPLALVPLAVWLREELAASGLAAQVNP